MRFTRWWNPSLPQTLSISAMLLYVNTVFSAFTLIGFPLGGSAYQLAPFVLSNSNTDLETFNLVNSIAVLGGLLAYGFAGLAISNSQKIGWKVGVAVSAGAVALPILFIARGFRLDGTYILSFLFDAALLVALLHPESRNYQRIWFDGPTKPSRRR